MEVAGLDVGFNEVGKLVEIAVVGDFVGLAVGRTVVGLSMGFDVVGIDVGAVVTCNFREMECTSDACVSFSPPSSPCGFKMCLSLFTSANNSSSISSKKFNNEISSNSSVSSMVDSSPVPPSNIIFNASFCSTISSMPSLPLKLVKSTMARHGPIPSIIHFRSIPGEVSQRFEPQR